MGTEKILQTNLQKLLNKQGLSCAEVERRAGLNQNNLYYVLKGITKNPSSKILQAVSETLGVTVNDLYNSSFDNILEENKFLNGEHINLLRKILDELSMEIESQKLQITENILFTLMREIYDFSKFGNKNTVDKDFIRWAIHQKKIPSK